MDKMNSRTRFKVVTFAPPKILLRPVLQENRKNCLQTHDLVETARTVLNLWRKDETVTLLKLRLTV